MSLNCYILIYWAFPHVCLVFPARLCDFGRRFKNVSLFAVFVKYALQGLERLHGAIIFQISDVAQ
jgi:hypothetical protein